MSLKIIGAGLGRTGTLSLKLALERLTGAPCYHMSEVWGTEGHIELWHRVARGEDVAWEEIFDGYDTVVDWPAAAFWKPLSEAYPDAKILLSTRDDAAQWFASASRTIFDVDAYDPDDDAPFLAMFADLTAHTFDGDYTDEVIAIAGYEAHNARVRAEADPERLIDYRAGDGWTPLCEALGVDIPDEEFPHFNTTEQFRERAGLDS